MAVVILEGKKDDINEEVIFARDSDDYPMFYMFLTQFQRLYQL